MQCKMPQTDSETQNHHKNMQNHQYEAENDHGDVQKRSEWEKQMWDRGAIIRYIRINLSFELCKAAKNVHQRK